MNQTAHPETFISTYPIVAPNQPHTNKSTMPKAATLPTPDAPARSPFSLVLANDGNGWLGTFSVLLTALLRDLLPEGALEASITYLDESDEETHQSGWIVGFNPATMSIDWANGAVVDDHQVLTIAI